MNETTFILALVLVTSGCYAGDDSEFSGLDETETGADTAGDETGTAETGGEDDTGEDGDTAGDEGEPPEQYPEEDCDYVLIHEQAGPVHTVSAFEPTLDVMPVAEGEGFYCLRVEFDITVPDALDDLLAVHEGCPEYLALASVFGTQATGDYLATSFFHGYALVEPEDEQADPECEQATPHVEVGNYVDYSVGTEAPWLPGQSWHVVLEAKPWLTRMDVDGEAGSTHRVEASLFPANLADTRDPVVRLGQAQVTGDMFYPWFGAQYANLRIEAVVAPAP